MATRVPLPQVTEEDLRKQISEALPDAARWLATPNRRLRGQSPEEAIAAGDLESVQNLLLSILYIGAV